MRATWIAGLGMSMLMGCTPSTGADDSAWVDGESAAADVGKADTGWQSSLDAQEVEVDLEGDVAGSSFSLARMPLQIGQFALTWFRHRGDVYLQSLAEDYSHGADRIEWLVDGQWVKTTSTDKMKHFRIRGVNAVVMHPGSQSALATKTWSPVVPKNPSTLWTDANDKCGTGDGSIDVDSTYYWYTWTPDKAGCPDSVKGTVDVKVSKVLPKGGTTYPEYDRLIADKKVDVLVLFGQVDHGELKDTDYGFTLVSDFERTLKTAGFKKAATAPKGLRYTRSKNGIDTTVDVYTPREFAGLDDWAHIDNFDEGVRSHEIVAYNGHSMLGASDFWARPSIYSSAEEANRYRIFVYNGCLGYEYYVQPILSGGGWDNTDLFSNTEETPFAIMVRMTATAVSMVVAGAESSAHNTSWNQVMTKMNTIATPWNSFYGASGIRDNKFHP